MKMSFVPLFWSSISTRLSKGLFTTIFSRPGGSAHSLSLFVPQPSAADVDAVYHQF